MRRLLAPILLTLALCGCTSLRESAHGATAVDGVTTVAGVASGVAVEANPLIGSPMAFAGVMLARVIGVELADKLDEPQRTQTLAGLNSVWWGVGVSNVLILISASNPVGLAAGAMAGLGWWASTGDQRAFAEICARERQVNPRLKCIYTTPAWAPAESHPHGTTPRAAEPPP